MDLWLLELTAFAWLQDAYDRGDTFTDAQRAEFLEALSNASGSLLSVSGGNGVIPIEGILTPKPDLFARLFGGGNTTYESILSALAEAEENPEVSAIELRIDSPGGNVAGLFDVMDAIREASKPTVAKVNNLAASAAYGIAASADKIVATSNAARFGSVGTVASFFLNDKRVEIANTDSPNKRPDLATEEGRAIVRREVDDMFNLFATAIAEGRGTTKATVSTQYGRGGILVAENALASGMIDGIERGLRLVTNSSNKSTADAGTKTKKEGSKMTLEELKASHPSVYEAIKALGHAEGMEAGVKQERGRVKAHLILGEKANAFDIAAKAIKDGEELTPEYQAEYIAAGMNAKAAGDRAAEASDTDAAAGADAPGEGETDTDFIDQVADSLDRMTGIDTTEAK